MNYTEEQTRKLVEMYKAKPSMLTVEDLAIAYGKSPKSIIGKLSREGVYERAIYKNKSGELPVTKAEIVSNIAENLGLEIEHLNGLEKAPKSTLKELEAATGAQQDQEGEDHA
jgi:predicted transcriptional regulator